MNDFNPYASTNNSWGYTSDLIPTRNHADITREYKNFLENDIDFNEQPDHRFRTKPVDLFDLDFDHEAHEIIQPDRKFHYPAPGFPNTNINVAKFTQQHSNRQDFLEDLSVKQSSTMDSVRIEPEEMRQPLLKDFHDDYSHIHNTHVWQFNKTASYQMNEFFGESHFPLKSQNHSKEYYDEGMHSMIATDSSMNDTPLNMNKKNSEPTQRSLLHTIEERNRPRRAPFQIIRDKPPTKGTESQAVSSNTIRFEQTPYLNNPPTGQLSSGSINSQMTQSTNISIQRPNNLSGSIPPLFKNKFAQAPANNTNKTLSTLRSDQNIYAGELVQLDLEEFVIEHNSPYPKFLTIPKKLQQLIEENPDTFFRGANLPQDIADYLKASKALKKLKFISKQKPGTLTAHERKQKILNYKQKKQNWMLKYASKDSNKQSSTPSKKSSKSKMIEANADPVLQQ